MSSITVKETDREKIFVDMQLKFQQQQLFKNLPSLKKKIDIPSVGQNAN